MRQNGDITSTIEVDAHRRLIVLRGEECARAPLLAADVEDDELLWIRSDDDLDTPRLSVPHREVKARLGRAFSLVILDARAALDPDVLGQVHGMVRGGGALILLLPPDGACPDGDAYRLTPPPHTREDVTAHFPERLIARLTHGLDDPPARPLSLACHEPRATTEQREVVDAIGEVLAGPPGARLVLTADRGRGKSSALGLALRRWREASSDTTSSMVAICAGSRDAVREVFHFAFGEQAPPDDASIQFVSLLDLVASEEVFTHILVDEAATLPVPFLQRLVRRQARARIVFATTTHGYEGTGRGFTLRFVAWLERVGEVTRRELREPIRWGTNDPLEARVFDALLLDAEVARVDPEEVDLSAIAARQLDRAELSRDERMLREVFGLLIQAHYRTTPSDLRRILDAPNLRLHALLHEGSVLAVTLVALEGDLSDALCEALYRGRSRIRGHALPETLVAHMSHREAGALSMCRSVRIAVHPAMRRAGLGTALIEHVHATYSPDLFGTIFGATPGLLAFRRSLGYELARIGASRGSRTGEPAVMMLRPVSEPARELFSRVREELAIELPSRLELLQTNRELLLDPELERACHENLPLTPRRSAAREREIIDAYVYGPRICDASAYALTRFMRAHEGALAALPAREQRLLRGRMFQRLGWEELAREVDLPSVTATMRAIRRAARALVERARDGEASGE